MIDSLIAETEKLTALIEDETTRLMQVRPADLADVVAQKEQYALRYAQLINSLKPLKPTMAALPESVRLHLRQSLAALETALLRNGDMLMRLQSGSRGLLESIALALNPQSQRVALYSASGIAPARPGGSIAVNAVF